MDPRVREVPDGVADDEILTAVRGAWLRDADAVEHLPASGRTTGGR